MDADDRLRALWQGQPLPRVSTQELFAQVHRHRRWLLLQRAVEAALTVAATAWFLWLRPYTPVEWLLLPYFSVFLVVVWSLNLRRSHPHAAATESVQIYAGLRQRQLRERLRELRLAQCCTDALVAYAVAALIATALWADAEWLGAARHLAAAAVLWWLLYAMYLRRARMRSRREYRAMKRLSKADGR
jgi:cation transport ATPase